MINLGRLIVGMTLGQLVGGHTATVVAIYQLAIAVECIRYIVVAISIAFALTDVGVQ